MQAWRKERLVIKRKSTNEYDYSLTLVGYTIEIGNKIVAKLEIAEDLENNMSIFSLATKINC